MLKRKKDPAIGVEKITTTETAENVAPVSSNTERATNMPRSTNADSKILSAIIRKEDMADDQFERIRSFVTEAKKKTPAQSNGAVIAVALAGLANRPDVASEIFRTHDWTAGLSDFGG